MENLEGKVVVDTTMHSGFYEDLERWVARLEGYGLTAYGETEKEAISIAEAMFAGEIRVHRRLGNLELWLNKLGVDWDWDDNYVKSEEREYKDVSSLRFQLPPMRSRSYSSGDSAPTRELALAA